MGVDLDRRLKSFAGRLGVAFLRLDSTQTDQGIDIIGVELESTAEAGLRIGQPALEQINRPQSLLGDGRPGRPSHLCLQRGLGRRDIAVIDRCLGVLDDLLRLSRLFEGRGRPVRPKAQPRPSCTRPAPRAAQSKSPHSANRPRRRMVNLSLPWGA